MGWGSPARSCPPRGVGPSPLKADRVPWLGVDALVASEAASPGTQLQAGGDAGGLWGAGCGPACPCLLLLPSSYCPGAGEVLPVKPAGGRNLCPVSRPQRGSPVRGHRYP